MPSNSHRGNHSLIFAGVGEYWSCRFFGSVARSSSRTDSDVDLLVTFDPEATWSTLDIVNLREELASLFGRKVDLVEERAIRNPYRKASILRDKSVLYAA